MCVRPLAYFKNTKDQFRAHEIRAANLMAYGCSYLSGSGPYGQSTEGFKRLLESGERVKFAVSSRGMFIGRTNISHASIAGFQQVITAGHAVCVCTANSYSEMQCFKEIHSLEIDNETGHYQVTTDSLKGAVHDFESMGYKVSVVKNWLTGEEVDFGSSCVQLNHGHDDRNLYFFPHEWRELQSF